MSSVANRPDSAFGVSGLERVHNDPEIYCVKVPLRDSPYKYVNSYIVQDGGETLVVDTGYDVPECKETIWRALRVLGADVGRTSLFVTHLHTDHAGSLSSLLPVECVRYVGAFELDYFQKWYEESYEEGLVRRFAEEGLPSEVFGETRPSQWVCSLDEELVASLEPLNEGDFLEVGQSKFQCVFAPGHTPGHACLFNEKKGILLMGDVLLFGVSPSMAPWPHANNSLKSYIQTLRKIGQLGVRVPCVAHFDNRDATEASFRAKDLLAHHYQRLSEILAVVQATPSLTAYQIAGLITWKGGNLTFSQLNLDQQYFAFAQSLVHLDYLYEGGLIARCRGVDGLIRYDLLDWK